MQTIQGSSKETRVLVVEDHADTAESLRLLLAGCGFHVTVAHTSQEGLETARKLEPDIVLCDIGLPDSDGYTVGSVLAPNRIELCYLRTAQKTRIASCTELTKQP